MAHRYTFRNTPPNADAIDRAAISLLPAGTVLGEVFRCMMQFKTFTFNLTRRGIGGSLFGSIPMHERQGFMKDLARGIKDPDTLSILAEFATMASALAYTSICANALLENKPLPDYQDTRVWKAAVIKGGGLGLFGDYYFKEFNRYNRRIESELAGPVGSDLIELIYNGNDEQKQMLESNEDMMKYLSKNIPGQNLFYLRPIIKMMVE